MLSIIEIWNPFKKSGVSAQETTTNTLAGKSSVLDKLAQRRKMMASMSDVGPVTKVAKAIQND